jgi:mycoredoxin
MSLDPGSPSCALPIVLWRPHCGFCRILLAELERHDIAFEARDIWVDDEARSWLHRRIGSETVPSVVIGDGVLVNPSLADVVEALDALSALDTDAERAATVEPGP